MTEDEAKTKWCPMVRLSIREDGNHRDTWAQTNRAEDVNCEGAANCIGSACMAWRETPERVEVRDMDYGQYPKGEEGWVNRGTSYDWNGLRYERRTPGVGFCGLAGSPR